MKPIETLLNLFAEVLLCPDGNCWILIKLLPQDHHNC